MPNTRAKVVPLGFASLTPTYEFVIFPKKNDPPSCSFLAEGVAFKNPNSMDSPTRRGKTANVYATAPSPPKSFPE